MWSRFGRILARLMTRSRSRNVHVAGNPDAQRSGRPGHPAAARRSGVTTNRLRFLLIAAAIHLDLVTVVFPLPNAGPNGCSTCLTNIKRDE